MRVRKISAQCVLQFTPSLAAGCVLHRPASRVIHCSESFFFFQLRIRLRDDRKKVCELCELEAFIDGKTEPKPSFGSERFSEPRTTRWHPLERWLPLRGKRRPSDRSPRSWLRGGTACPRRRPAVCRTAAPIMILPLVHRRKPCYDF